ncbi:MULTISPECIES: hypothetical protein [Methanocorpusculum]|jgi:hypothetical protein|uniref:Uncharacterized protein n=1 Tax=Methanocorpusculum parvum TaxID=2193 RepID=A0AAX0QBX9_9EURY|nr:MULTISPECIES: hypothetical protein [Methanocorpusculum]MDD2248288.1 hypothetical protein [Methanocorpusculum sp.]MDD2802569.1 hypothetical protein [Methanocorpusculum sp.]MDD3046738.1 hypothetical protein [Methanocorpusculum sp.]MDD3912038.1 hypothetical protein [Methanocorpusculum sp.]MDD4423074.1 hypothetical protein [Methanocorpusculum parvum]
MTSEKVKDAFEKEGISTEITCAKAHEMSEKYAIPITMIGNYCNVHDIKVQACMLGCFSGKKHHSPKE